MKTVITRKRTGKKTNSGKRKDIRTRPTMMTAMRMTTTVMMDMTIKVMRLMTMMTMRARMSTTKPTRIMFRRSPGKILYKPLSTIKSLNPKRKSCRPVL